MLYVRFFFRHLVCVQTYLHCETCTDEGRFTEDEGVCVTCARVCHLGHEMSEEITDRPFFCDCGPSGHCNVRIRNGSSSNVLFYFIFFFLTKETVYRSRRLEAAGER